MKAKYLYLTIAYHMNIRGQLKGVLILTEFYFSLIMAYYVYVIYRQPNLPKQPRITLPDCEVGRRYRRFAQPKGQAHADFTIRRGKKIVKSDMQNDKKKNVYYF